jgi:hypothetical protein
MRDLFSLSATRLKFVLTVLAVCAGLFALVFMQTSPASATAQRCYEGFGCPHTDKFKYWQLKQASCQILWEMRNYIYKDNGYCFQTPEAISHFGNAGCTINNMGNVPLNSVERYNISKIIKAEKFRGCGPHGEEG